MTSKLDEQVRRLLNSDASDETVSTLTEKAVAEIVKAIDLPLSTVPSSRGNFTELIIAFPAVDTQISIKLGNLASNALHPTGVRQFLTAQTAMSAASAGGPIAWIAFALALTALAAKPVPFAETCILHKAWRMVKFDRLITVNHLVKNAESIVEEYGIVKVSSADIETYLNNLVRLGCVRDHVSGYELVEKVVMADVFGKFGNNRN